MLKKNDTLPLILALVSTVLIVATGFNWLTKNNIAGFGQNDFSQNSFLKTPDVQENPHPSPSSSPSTVTRANFVLPAIVPQGTSVTINGSDKLDQINTALRKGFHQQYPGTAIITDTDGSDVGLNLLYSGEIDLLALDRPLNQAEQAAGLMAIQINSLKVQHNQKEAALYYVYRKPLEPNIESFLGYAFSESGKKAINSH
jgi:phosphate transport system substrate-binding protein